MQYKYGFEAASLLFMLVVLAHFAIVRQFPTAKTTVFRALLFVCIGECAANLLSCFGLANPALVPQTANEWIAFCFFALEGLSSYLIYLYIVAVCGMERGRKRAAVCVGAVLSACFFAFLLSTPFTGFFYCFEENVYHQGFGADFGYFYIGCFFLLNLAVMELNRKHVGIRQRTIIWGYTLIAVGSIAVQYFYRDILLTSAGNAVIIFMIYLAMQNPGELFDTVTGIGNGEALEIQLQDAMRGRKSLAVITVYIRHYHRINMLFGAENGNRLLSIMGQYFYRLGGKFHVFRSETTSFTVLAPEEKCAAMTEKIKGRFAQEWQLEGSRILVEYAVVIQHCPKDFSTMPEFLGMREYLADLVGKDGGQAVIETDRQMIEGYYRRNKVEVALDRALANHALDVYYQPIYSLKERRIVALEALSRLKDEELGFIPPDEFIPVAEKSGKIVKIGEIVLEECCKFLSKHVLSNTSLGLRSIQVNISAAQCMRQNLTEAVLAVLEKYHVPTSMIVLELTESTAISAPALMERHMTELGRAGISFAMDDYGTGHANFSYLVRYPFREVKIDKDMTWAYFANDTARIVLGNEINTMQRLEIPMVIEGIETREQSEEMERLGVQYIQGYYYGKPMPEAELLRYIRSFNAALETY